MTYVKRTPYARAMPRREDISKVDLFIPMDVWGRLEPLRSRRGLAHALRMQMAILVERNDGAHEDLRENSRASYRAGMRFTFECETAQLLRFAELVRRIGVPSRQRALNALATIAASRLEHAAEPPIGAGVNHVQS